jgi:hypothetical protein
LEGPASDRPFSFFTAWLCLADAVVAAVSLFHCVEVFFCPTGLELSLGLEFVLFHCVRLFFARRVGRLLGACSPPLAARLDSVGHDPAVRPGVGPLGVRKHPRPRHPTPDPHARDPVASGVNSRPTRQAE